MSVMNVFFDGQFISCRTYCISVLNEGWASCAGVGMDCGMMIMGQSLGHTVTLSLELSSSACQFVNLRHTSPKLHSCDMQTHATPPPPL